jgi:hypothetical protein
MLHVLVETNWVVDCIAPRYRRGEAAMGLLERAREGELELHVPAFCLQEARRTVQRKYHPRTDAQAIRRFLRWGSETGNLTAEEVMPLGRFVDSFEQLVARELSTEQLARRMKDLREAPGVDVFALDAEMVELLVELGASGPELGPIDEAVLAAVLVRGRQLRERGVDEVLFCEADGDLQPWIRKGRDHGSPREPLHGLYRKAGVRVINGFVLE